MLNNQTILITGGTGSFGKKFVETVLTNYKVAKIIIFSRDEHKQFEMQNSSPFKEHANSLQYIIGDIRDASRIMSSVEDVDIVIHAAAMKQVPAAEYNPFEAVKTNVIGSQNVIDACIKSGVKKVIALSTNKAAAPVNLYGATKLTSDKLFIAANNAKGKKNIMFSVVRYGNVFGSRGSVVPLFLEQKKSGTLTITDERMTRFSINPEQGVMFVINCLEIMLGGEIFIPKLPSFRVTELAKVAAPNAKLEFIGLRPGEKIHEELITENESHLTVEFKNHYVILPSIPANFSNMNDFISKSIEKGGKKCESGFCYSSDNNKQWLSVKDLSTMIKNI
jgi:UDP-N-acetylglucosamine 4,6-dehydratase/5-epimerase